MTIDLDVAATAKHFGLDPRLLQAVVNAEGPGMAILKAVQCSTQGVTTRTQALEIAARTLVHALSDYVRISVPTGFVEAFAAKWAPEGVANDPTHLNENFARNMRKLWLGA